MPEEPSLEEIEENPELLAAEAAVNELPPPPPSGASWVQGAGARMVTFPGPDPEEAVENIEETPLGSGTTAEDAS
ncbi:MAG TPA: hypothetical protein VG368_02095 [Acidimicrobiales bacterium]|nr:hypothetical protein [Acidimicrobiales bacterium]